MALTLLHEFSWIKGLHINKNTNPNIIKHSLKNLFALTLTDYQYLKTELTLRGKAHMLLLSPCVTSYYACTFRKSNGYSYEIPFRFHNLFTRILRDSARFLANRFLRILNPRFDFSNEHGLKLSLLFVLVSGPNMKDQR